MSEKLSFEKANSKLESLIEEMESGKLTLEESMKVYEEAFNLLSYCYDQLENYKGQIMDINTKIETIKEEGLFND